MPAFIKETHLRIVGLLSESSLKNDGGILLLAASRLVLLNTIRALPHYLGTFLIVEVVKEHYSKSYIRIVFLLFSIIPIVYYLINLIYDIDYDFGGPAYLSIVVLIIIYNVSKDIKNFTSKFIIVVLFLFGFQWLDVIPYLSQFNFGRGEISVIIKNLAEIIGAVEVLNFFGSFFALTIIISALIISRMFITNYRVIEAVREKKDKEIELKKMKVKRVEDRANKEMRYLVHDLKTPLTTIRGLNDVIFHIAENTKVKEHTKRIEKSVKNLDIIISEIMNEKTHLEIEIYSFVNLLKNHLSGQNYVNIIEVENNIEGIIFANKMRLVRAVINLVNNSVEAIQRRYKDEYLEEGCIKITFIRENKYLKIIIKDNGIGFKDDEIKNDKLILNKEDKEEFLGIGIEFVKNVVYEHNGFLKINTLKEKGAEVIIFIPLY